MKMQRTIHLEKDEILQAVEQELIQTWRKGELTAPTSPLQAAATFAMHKGDVFSTEKQMKMYTLCSSAASQDCRGSWACKPDA